MCTDNWTLAPVCASTIGDKFVKYPPKLCLNKTKKLEDFYFERNVKPLNNMINFINVDIVIIFK